MSECLGCNRCEDGPMKTLVSGVKVCPECPAWMEECEARHLLSMPLQQRWEALSVREKKRGKESVDSLKKVMQKIHGRLTPNVSHNRQATAKRSGAGDCPG